MSDELIVIEREDALKAFTDEKAFEEMFSSIKALAEEVKPDLTTAKGRKDHKSFCFKIRKTKARIDDVRTDLTEDMRKQISAINERGKAMVERLEDLHDEVRRPLTEWEDAEKLRVDTIRKAIEDARAVGQAKFGETSQQIQQRMDKLPTYDLDWYAEFRDEAELVLEAAFNSLALARTAALNAEKEAEERQKERAELARLKKAEEERLAKEAEAEAARKAEEERAAKVARDAEEKLAAERAEMERKQAELQRQLDDANRKAAEAEKAAQEAQEREKAAAEAERRRIAEERAAAERRAEEERRVAEEEKAAKLAAIERTEIARQEAIEDFISITSKAPPTKDYGYAPIIVDAIRAGEIRHLRFEA